LNKTNKNGVFVYYDRLILLPCHNLKQVEIRGSKAKTNAKTRRGAKTLKRQLRFGFEHFLMIRSFSFGVFWFCFGVFKTRQGQP